MQNGMQVEPQFTVEVMQNKIAQAAIREAMLEAAIQQLLSENERLAAMLREQGDSEE